MRAARQVQEMVVMAAHRLSMLLLLPLVGRAANLLAVPVETQDRAIQAAQEVVQEVVVEREIVITDRLTAEHRAGQEVAAPQVQFPALLLPMEVVVEVVQVVVGGLGEAV